jgi:hypothetical protein
MQYKAMILVVALGVLIALCFYFVFEDTDSTDNAQRGQASEIPVQTPDRPNGRSSDTATAPPENNIPNGQEPGTRTPVAETDSQVKERTERRARIVSEFQRYLGIADRFSDEHSATARSIAKLAWQDPDIIVEKFLTGDQETRIRSMSVLCGFDQAGADTSPLVRCLCDVYPRVTKGEQTAILLVFHNAHAKPALPFLREALDDTREGPCMPGEETDEQMCNYAYDAIVAIIEYWKIEHEGLEIEKIDTTVADIELMKKWLDEHPDLLKPPEKKDKKQ